MPQKPDLRSSCIRVGAVSLLVVVALFGCGDKYPASACTAITSVTWDRRDLGCNVEWSCEFGQFFIDCDLEDEGYACRCFADGEEVARCHEADFCDHTDDERAWVREANACCGFDVVATDFAK